MDVEEEDEEEEEEDEDAEEEDRSQDREAHFARACAVEMYTDKNTRVIMCGNLNLQEKCRTPSRRHPFCASLRSRNTHGYVRRSILC